MTSNGNIKRKHFLHYWPFVRGIHRSAVDSPHKGQWCGALMFSLICAWTNCWENHQDACDLRSNRSHYDVTVMIRKYYQLHMVCWNLVALTHWSFKKIPVILTHCGLVMPFDDTVWVSIGSGNGLLPLQHHAIIQTNDGSFLIGPLGTIFSEIIIKLQQFLYKNMSLKMSSAKWQPLCILQYHYLK